MHEEESVSQNRGKRSFFGTHSTGIRYLWLLGENLHQAHVLAQSGAVSLNGIFLPVSDH